MKGNTFELHNQILQGTSIQDDEVTSSSENVIAETTYMATTSVIKRESIDAQRSVSSSATKNFNYIRKIELMRHERLLMEREMDIIRRK